MKRVLRIATRKSPLALWQAKYVEKLLLKVNSNLETAFVTLTTTGDKVQTKALTKIGGKLLFVKELQNALLSNTADIAVHSIKDLPVQNFPGLTLVAICEREDPRDAFISARYTQLQDLPKGATVGTASPRRMALLKSQRPDIQIKILRGNVGTRLNKCEQGEYDATVLAAAGLKRLNLDNHIREYLDPNIFIPAIGQGAIGVECREEDTELCELIRTINHRETSLCVMAERAVNQVLGGDCHTPIAAHAIIDNRQMRIWSMVGSPSGKSIIHSEVVGLPEDAVTLGKGLGQQLLDKGASALLSKE